MLQGVDDDIRPNPAFSNRLASRSQSSSTTITEVDMSADVQLTGTLPKVSPIARVTAGRQWTTPLSRPEPSFLKPGGKPFTKLGHRVLTGTGNACESATRQNLNQNLNHCFCHCRGVYGRHTCRRLSPAF